MEILIGDTGFVGSNIADCHHFDGLYHSKNITEAYHIRPDLCVYAGVRAQKFLANAHPDKDREEILTAIENIKRIQPKQLILISTVDVYAHPQNMDENSPIELDELPPYGRNRRELELWVQQNLQDYLIVRLPGLFGKKIKKNFIYDLLHPVPSMLSTKKFQALSAYSDEIRNSYIDQKNGFYQLRTLSQKNSSELSDVFRSIGFSALSFTDSRAVFQFYNLKWLWQHIKTALSNEIRTINLVTEPIAAGDIYRAVIGKAFCNHLSGTIPNYNCKTIYAEQFGGENGYIASKEVVCRDICEFVQEELRR